MASSSLIQECLALARRAGQECASLAASITAAVQRISVLESQPPPVATFDALTDKTTADLPAINSPLAAALAGKETAGAAAAAQAYSVQRANHTGTQAQSTIVNLVSDLAAKASLAGNNTFTGQQEFTDFSTWLYTAISRANHLSSLGAGTTGAELFQAATPEAARDAVRTKVVLGADVLSTSATFAATGLSLTLTAGVEYLLRGSLDLVPGSSTSGAKLQLTTSQAIDCVQANGCAVGLVMQSGSGPSVIGLLTTSRSDFFSYTGATLYRRVLIELRLKLVATGTVSINFAQVAAEATASRVKAGAYLTSEIL